MKIFISKNARDNLYLYLFYKRKYSPHSAKEFFKDFNSKIQSLSLFPYMYPKLLSDNSYRKILFNKKYIILYTIYNNNIYIDSVLYCGQDYLKL